MNYETLVKDFARRTKHNLEVIDRLSLKPDCEVFEVTQLVNSLLGLLVFPQQRFFNSLPNIPLEELEKQGWPHINLLEGDRPANNLRDLLRYMRNAVAHFQLEILADSSGKINGIEFKNNCPNCHRLNWKTRLTLNELRQILERFLELIEKIEE